MRLVSRLARQAVHSRLAGLGEGRLTLEFDGDTHMFGSGDSPAATVSVTDPAFFPAIAFGGHLAAAECFIRGGWEADDLTALVQVLLRNRDVLDGLESGPTRLIASLRALRNRIRRNTRRGSRRNILAHYDRGNRLFELFLDETMTYSCGIFERPESTMKDASIAKYDRICTKLGLNDRDHVIEIGSGWGGFAIHAASRYGCRVTTATISDAQYELASERIAAAGVGDRVTVIKADYRDLEGTYDKLVSIEMIEAVGHSFYGRYFEKCAQLLGPHGLAAIQAITIQDRYYDSARREVDFIKRYIFPGGCIPAVSVLASAAMPTDLRLVHLEDITPHYAETLRRWRRRFEANWPEIEALGFGEDFRRLWQFYLCYCEGGFNEAVLGDVQLLFAKPRATIPSVVRVADPGWAVA